MSENGKPDPPWPDPQYEQNRAKFPLEELAKYAGQYVAFSMDGTRILASADTMEAVEEKLVAAGINPNRVVGSYIDGPEDYGQAVSMFDDTLPPEEDV
jgi:hypothetical protein